LVADVLEALEREHDHQRQADQGLLSEEARQQILGLTKDLRRVWNDPATVPLERKRMVALLIEDATLIKEQDIRIHVRFRGGRTTSLTVDRPQSMALVRKTRSEVVDALDRLLETYTDREAAVALNERGYRNWQGQSFTPKKVSLVRRTYGLKSRFERLRARGLLTGEEMAHRLGVSTTTVHTLGRTGLLPRHLYGSPVRCLYEPIDPTLFLKGKGGRRPRPPALITVPSSAQETV
jgi:hypothetical protein